MFYNFPSVALWKEMHRFICTSWAGGAVFLCAVSRSTQGAFLGRVWGKEDRMAINDYPPRPPSCTGRQWLTRPDLPPTLTHLWGHVKQTLSRSDGRLLATSHLICRTNTPSLIVCRPLRPTTYINKFDGLLTRCYGNQPANQPNCLTSNVMFFWLTTEIRAY